MIPRESNNQEPESIHPKKCGWSYKNSLQQLRQKKQIKLQPATSRQNVSDINISRGRCVSLDSLRYINKTSKDHALRRRIKKTSADLGLTIDSCDIKPKFNIKHDQIKLQPPDQKISLSTLFKTDQNLTPSHGTSLMLISSIKDKKSTPTVISVISGTATIDQHGTNALDCSLDHSNRPRDLRRSVPLARDLRELYNTTSDYVAQKCYARYADASNSTAAGLMQLIMNKRSSHAQ